MLNEFYILFFIKLVDISQRERGFFIISTTMTLVRKSKVPINEKNKKTKTNKQTNTNIVPWFTPLLCYCSQRKIEARGSSFPKHGISLPETTVVYWPGKLRFI